MVELFVHKERHIKLVRHQARANMPGERRIAFYRRQIARATPFVCHIVFVINPERKRRVVVEEKGGHMVIEDIDQRIRFFLIKPALQRLKALENRCPCRVLLFVMIDGKADGRGMRNGDPAEYSGHKVTPLIGYATFATARSDPPLFAEA